MVDNAHHPGNLDLDRDQTRKATKARPIVRLVDILVIQKKSAGLGMLLVGSVVTKATWKRCANRVEDEQMPFLPLENSP